MRRYLMVTTRMQWPPECITKLGWDVKIKSMQETELFKMCLGSFIIRNKPNLEVAILILHHSKAVISFLINHWSEGNQYNSTDLDMHLWLIRWCRNVFLYKDMIFLFCEWIQIPDSGLRQFLTIGNPLKMI